MKPLVSIIIAAYNIENYIDDCIKSCVEQSYKNIEIVVVDDGSTDDTGRIADKWHLSDDRVVVLHKRNGGLSQARNSGLDISRGSMVVFLDGDDYFGSDMIASLVSNWDGCDYTVVGTEIIRFKEKINNSTKEHFQSVEVKKGEFIGRRKGFYCWGILYSKRLLMQANIRFDESLKNLEDVAWISFVFLYVRKLILIEKTLYFYRVNQNSITSKSKNVLWQIRSWICTKNSIESNMTTKKMTISQYMELRRRIRMCKNNIFAELISGGYGLKEYSDLYLECNKQGLPLCEKIEYRIFLIALKIKRYLRDLM